MDLGSHNNRGHLVPDGHRRLFLHEGEVYIGAFPDASFTDTVIWPQKFGSKEKTL